MSIPTVPLGSQGLRVSRQGLGCMGMSAFYGSDDEKESIATLQRAIELGVTFWDTAQMYGWGANEELLGRVLAGRRDQVVIAWVDSRGDDVVPIPGTRRPSRLEENVGALEVTFTRDELDHLEPLSRQVVGARH